MGILNTPKEDTKPKIKPLPTVAPASVEQQLQEIGVPEEPELMPPPVSSPVGASVEQELMGQDAAGVMPATAPPEGFTVAPSSTAFTQPFEVPKQEPSPKLPEIWQNIGKDYGNRSIYAPEIIQTKLPTLYNSTVGSINDSYKQGTNYLQSAIGQQNQAAQEQAQQAQKFINDRNTINLPRVDKKWSAPGDDSNWFKDIIFGSKKQQEESQQKKVFNPFKGQFSEQGAGVGGAFKYIANLGVNLTAGVAANANVSAEIGARLLGANEEQATNFARNGFLGLLPKQFRPSSVLGFDWDRARNNNLAVDALLGKNVGDLNDAASNRKGVFFDPGRDAAKVKPKQAQESNNKLFDRPSNQIITGVKQGYNDFTALAAARPVNTAIEVLYQLANPGDNAIGTFVETSIRRLGNRAVKKVVPVVAQTNASKPMLSLPPGKSNSIPVEEQLRVKFGSQIKTPVGQRQLPGTQGVNMSSPITKAPTGKITTRSTAVKQAPVQMNATLEPMQTAAVTRPTKAPRILIGDSSVIQKALPPAIPPKAMVSGDYTNTPAEFSANVGIGKPSELPILAPADIEIAGVDLPPLAKGDVEFVNEAAGVTPRQAIIRENLKIRTTEESSAEAAKVSMEYAKADLEDGEMTYAKYLERLEYVKRDLSSVDYDAYKSYRPVPTINNLTKAAEELAASKAIVDAPLQQLEQYFDDTVDFGRKLTDDIPYKLMQPEDVAQALDTGAKLNLPTDAYRLIETKEPGLAEIIKSNDTEAMTDYLRKTGKSTANVESIIAEANNTVLTQVTKVESKTPKQTFIKTEEEGTAGEVAKMKNVFTSKLQSTLETNDEYVKTFVDSAKETGAIYRPMLVKSSPRGEVQVLVGGSEAEAAKILRSADPKLYENTNAFIAKTNDEAKAAANQIDFLSKPEYYKYRGSDNTRVDQSLIPVSRIDEAIVLNKSQEALAIKLSKEIILAKGNVIPLVVTRGGDKSYRAVDNVLAKAIKLAREAEPKLLENARALIVDDVDKAQAIAAQIGRVNSKTKKTKSLPFTTKMPDDVFHGTALKDWEPTYNIKVNGSRGELGSGLYLIDKAKQAENYARARISENVSAGALEKDISPAVYQLTQTFDNTFNARSSIPSNSPVFVDLMQGFPNRLEGIVRQSLQRDAKTTYVGFFNKVEASLVKAGLDPTEETLKEINGIVSDNLRRLGYDSVYDSKSGFALVLDETKVKTSDRFDLPAAERPIDSAVARYNADAQAAKYYPERLTTDANLRDSAYKVQSQLSDTLDTKLKKIQDEIIKRGVDPRPNVLPARESTNKAPATLEEAFEKLNDTDICNL